MTPRASKAQRAAVGGKVVPLTGNRRAPTTDQIAAIKQLRATYGKAVKSVLTVDRMTGHVTIVMDTSLGDTYWVVDAHGVVIARYEPQPLWPGSDDAA